MQAFWNFEQLLGLSPDHFTIRSGQGNAKLDKWQSLSNRGHFVWGEYKNRNRSPYQTALDLNHMHFSCTCAGKKFPCQHMVGLNLLWHHNADEFEHTAVPAWVRLNQTRFLQYWHRQQKLTHTLISEDELAELRRGLAELERWLHDLMQHGLASLPERPKETWRTIANRMADVQAMRLSQKLLDLSIINNSQPNWPERYLKRLSPLAMLLAAFDRFEEHDLATQADLLTAVGRPFSPPLDNQPPLHDQWLVLGHQVELLGQQQHHHTWLWGLTHRQPAQLTQIIRGKHPKGVRYVTGSMLTADLQYKTSHTPLLAQLGTKPILNRAPAVQIETHSILEAVRHINQLRVKNPWLQSYPLLLRGMRPLFENGRWTLLDQKQYALPLPEKFSYGWHLQALTGNDALTLFGLWSPRHFSPLSVEVNEKWIDLHTFRGIK